MSRKGNCLNNSPTENFFVRIKEKMFYDKECLYKDIYSLIISIIRYIEYYNEERIVNKFYMSPVMYKTNYWKNKNYSVKYSQSYKPIVKINGEGSNQYFLKYLKEY